MHKFDVWLVRDNWPVDVGEGLRALRTSSCLLRDERQSLRILLDDPHKLLRLFIEGGVLYQVIDAFVDFFELLPIPQVRLFHGGAYGGSFVVGVLEGLIFHLYGDVGFLE